jgi:prepilin-type N-terminal cleavage/methylation domain-containing protein
MFKKGFTLVELLVVISIIAVLLSVLMPALSSARNQAKITVCLSSVRQVALGALTYEAQARRLPSHLWEVSIDSFGRSDALPKQVAMGLLNTRYDVRSIYKSFVNVDYFKCPMVPKWDMPVSKIDSTYNIYSDYFISGGYWASIKKDQKWSDIVGRKYTSSVLFTKSSEYWTYGGYKFNVLFGDCLWRKISSNQLRTNHPVKGVATKFLLSPPNKDKWAEAFYYGIYTKDDEMNRNISKIKSNYIFADGSGSTLKGDDPRMVEVLHRRDTDYSFYLPHK